MVQSQKGIKGAQSTTEQIYLKDNKKFNSFKTKRITSEIILGRTGIQDSEIYSVEMRQAGEK